MSTSTFNKTELNSIITEFAMSIGAYQGNDYIVSGTATVVAPHLAITAKHVVEHFWREFKRSELVSGEVGSHKEINGNFNMIAVQIQKSGAVGALWEVRQIYFSNTTDIAYLHLIPNSEAARNYEWRTIRLEMLPQKLVRQFRLLGIINPRQLLMVFKLFGNIQRQRRQVLFLIFISKNVMSLASTFHAYIQTRDLILA